MQIQEISVRTPSEIHKNERHRNDWFLKDLSNISKSILDIGKIYRTYVQMHRDDKRISNSNDLTKLLYTLYLTAARIGEPLKKQILIRKTSLNGYVVMHTEKINEKHFIDYTQVGTNKKGKPIYEHSEENKIMTQNLPIDNEYEREMWDFVLEGGLYGNEKKLDFSSLGGYKKRTEITNKFKYNFKADLTDGDHLYRQAGIVPHMLRHLRVYNLRFNTYPLRPKGYDESLVQSFLGWKNKDMFETYTYILKQIKDEEQIRILGGYLEGQKDIPKPRLTDLFTET